MTGEALRAASEADIMDPQASQAGKDSPRSAPRFPDTWMDHRPGERYPWADTLDEELDARERRERARYPETEDAA